MEPTLRAASCWRVCKQARWELLPTVRSPLKSSAVKLPFQRYIRDLAGPVVAFSQEVLTLGPGH